MVRAIHAGRVVDGVAVDAPARHRIFDAPQLGEAQVAALAHDLAAKVLAVHADRVVGAVAYLRIGLVGRLHVGSDAAVVEEVDGRLEDRLHELGGCELRRHDAEHCPGFSRQRDRLGAARKDAAALRDELLVVVVPRGARQREEPLAFLEGLLHVRRRVDEDVAVVERRHQPDVPRQQHAVAEDIARHVADADHREILRLGIDPHLAEMALDALPRSARRDAHLLVVVAHAAAGGECVSQPESVLGRDRVRVVGERRRALVRRDHEVRIVRVVAHHILRRHHLAAHEVVGHVEQPAQEILVAGDTLLHEGFAIRRGRRALQHEAAFRSRGNDHRVLHDLRLHEAQHLGAEILGTVGPSQAAARDLAAAQVDRLEARRVHPDLEHRARIGKLRNLRGLELERDERLPRPVGALDPMIGAQGGADEAQVPAQDPVLVGHRHVVQLRLDVLLDLRLAGIAIERRATDRSARGRAPRGCA